MRFSTPRQEFDLRHRALLMAVLNVTPDSFSEQGRHFALAAALAAARAMIADGADILDIGGESTRPGATPVPVAEELRRVLPVIEALRRESTVVISVDTTKAEVARAATAAGADIINDISGLTQDPEILAVARDSGAGLVLMHMRGTPQTMRELTDYRDLFGELNDCFAAMLARTRQAGIPDERVALDPGIGFAKTAEQNLLLINGLDRFLGHGRPILLGPSRKSFIGKVLNQPDPTQRVWGTGAAVAVGLVRGARLIRVHDVAEMRQIRDLTMAILTSPNPADSLRHQQAQAQQQ